jgi:putative ABC transport system permease protein
MLEKIWQDIRFSFRGILRQPGLAAVALITLGLGLGANVAVFSLLNAALFRSAPVGNPGELAWIATTRGGGGRFTAMSYPEFVAYRDSIKAFSGAAGYQDIPLALGSGGEPAQIAGLITTWSYFDVLQVPMSFGRSFVEDDDREGAPPVVVLSERLHRERFGLDPSILGRKITLNGAPVTVIGVAGRGFAGSEMGSPVDAWLTLSAHPIAMPGRADFMTNPGVAWLRVVGRLAPRASVEEASAGARVVARRLAAAHPRELEAKVATVLPLSGGLDPANRSEAMPVLFLLMGVPMMVLLIACANVANLLLSRATGRANEIGVRTALGATRGRLVRQLMTESMVLAILGVGVALLTAGSISRGVLSLAEAPPELAGALGAIDTRVLAFALLAAVASAFVFGLAPALSTTGPGTGSALKDTQSAGGTRRRSRLMSGLVTTQVAVSLVLLVVAGLFIRSLGKAISVDPGFDTQAVTASFDLGLQRYSVERADAFTRSLVERLNASPGVRVASVATEMPLSGRMRFIAMVKPDAPADDYGVGVASSSVRPGFFETLGIPLVTGRDFSAADDRRTAGVAVINQTGARRFWPDEDAVGKRLRVAGDGGAGQQVEIIGIVRDSKYDELVEDPRPFLYFPLLQQTEVGPLTVIARADVPPDRLAPILRDALRSLDPALPVVRVATIRQLIAARVDKNRAAAALLGSFGTLALVLAALGLYGVMAYAIAQRSREIGVRVALGASPRDVHRLFVGQGLRRVAAGLTLGVVLSGLVAGFLSPFLFGVTLMDLPTFASAIVLLLGVAVLASLIPAWRATRADPALALRRD